jgi:hypothetical protein
MSASSSPIDLVGHGLAVLLFEVDGRAEHAASLRVEELRVDDLGVAELGLDLLDPALDEALAFFRRVVLSAFSDRSPWVRASAIAVIAFGRSTVFNRCSSCRNSSAPVVVSGMVLMASSKKSVPAPWAPGCGIGYSEQKEPWKSIQCDHFSSQFAIGPRDLKPACNAWSEYGTRVRMCRMPSHAARAPATVV